MVFDAALNPYVSRVREHATIATGLDGFFIPDSSRRSVLDLGCGNGHFLESLVLKEPQLFAVGIEKRFKRAFKSAEKIQRSQYSPERTKGTRILQMNWIDFLMFSPTQIWDEIWLQFPDPWPKTRHEKNRLVTALNISLIAKALKPGGVFCFRSDCLDYFETLVSLNERHRYFSEALLGRANDIFRDSPQTLFQKKFLLKGEPIHSARFKI